MAGLSPLPTHQIHSTERLTHREAHTFLSTFLDHADTEAAYRPDSTLTERGPQAVSTGSSPNLTLHHLKRILLGLEGKRLRGDLVREEGEAEGEAEANHNHIQEQEHDSTTAGSKGVKRKAGNDDNDQHQQSQSQSQDQGQDRDLKKKKSSAKRKTYNAANIDEHDDLGSDYTPAVGGPVSDGEGWQDKDTFALAQTEHNLEATAGDRHPGADLEQPGDEGQEEDMMYVQVEGGSKKLSQQEKEERKKLKKLRSKEDKAKRAQKKKQ
jgi:hypothetical protein